MAKQVKLGIEGVLGVQVLRDLQQHLRDYASLRRSGVEKIEDTTLSRVQAQIAEIETRLEPLAKERTAFENQSKTVREKRDALMKSLRTMTGGGMESVRELHENKLRFSQMKRASRTSWSRSFTRIWRSPWRGGSSSPAWREVIQGEVMGSQWLAGKEQTRDGLPIILAGLEADETHCPARCPAAQLTVIRERVKVAWESLWHPPPPGCPEEFRHTYLADSDRTSILNRLDKVDRFTITELGKFLGDHEEAAQPDRPPHAGDREFSGVEDPIKEVERGNREAQRQRPGSLGRRPTAPPEEADRPSSTRIALNWPRALSRDSRTPAEPHAGRSGRIDLCADW